MKRNNESGIVGKFTLDPEKRYVFLVEATKVDKATAQMIAKGIDKLSPGKTCVLYEKDVLGAVSALGQDGSLLNYDLEKNEVSLLNKNQEERKKRGLSIEITALELWMWRILVPLNMLLILYLINK